MHVVCSAIHCLVIKDGLLVAAFRTFVILGGSYKFQMENEPLVVSSTNRAEECMHLNSKWDLELKIMTRATSCAVRVRDAVMRAHSNRPRARIARTRFFDVGARWERRRSDAQVG